MFSSLTEIYNIFLQHPDVVTDSRNLVPSCFFFALRGERFNGNHFAAEALEKGAAMVLVDEPEYKINPQCILVEDVLKTLQELALHHRKQFNIPVLAITGTNGKTTTKELVSRVLETRYNVISTTGNLNNHIGVPLTLLRLKRDTHIAVIEMGANHPGEIDFLCRIALPDHGIITNIGKAHLEGFGGFEGVIKTKTELYHFLADTNGKVFVNAGDSLLMQLSEGLEKITYGFTASAWLRGSLEKQGDLNSFMIGQTDGENLPVQSKLFGDYNAVNILASACIGRYFEVSDQDIRLAVESYEPSNNRSQVKTTLHNILILDAYNANPSSMEAALRFFASSDYLNKMVILGDMLELGNESDEYHKHILALLEELSFEDVYLVGPTFTRINTRREFLCFGDSILAKLWLEHHAPEGKSILLKGSRGMKLETVAEIL
ncbi:MAG: UDP-N-acetylmuramoyl-tripeptide--D-alanyl-D-alanine ligase [Bacteroidetes bacterium]|nr:UDP-N-acetylmuramoyl-tripeptide--D-alanyl-D-alanine ligase [Bacteroidota bacterium]